MWYAAAHMSLGNSFFPTQPTEGCEFDWQKRRLLNFLLLPFSVQMLPPLSLLLTSTCTFSPVCWVFPNLPPIGREKKLEWKGLRKIHILCSLSRLWVLKAEKNYTYRYVLQAYAMHRCQLLNSYLVWAYDLLISVGLTLHKHTEHEIAIITSQMFSHTHKHTPLWH